MYTMISVEARLGYSVSDGLPGRVPLVLTDLVPLWSTLESIDRDGIAAFRAERAESCYGDPGDAVDDIRARWDAACLLAHQAGCPPHPADKGFNPTHDGWWVHPEHGKDVALTCEPRDDGTLSWVGRFFGETAVFGPVGGSEMAARVWLYGKVDQAAAGRL